MRDFFRIQRDCDRSVSGQLRRSRRLLWTNERIRDQHVSDTGVEHYGSFAEFSDSDSRGAAGDLAFRELRNFVSLGVRAQQELMLAAVVTNAR